MIELESVVMDYGNHRALDGLQLTVKDGCVYGLLGPNGAGKSTTINLVTGLLRPTSGRITVGGVDAVAKPEESRRNLAYVPESVALYTHLSGIENLQLFSRLAGRSLGSDECVRCLQQAGLQTDAHTRRISTYSKGMRQKVGLAIALAKGARALVLDEPSSGLDPSASHDLANRVRELAANGVAVLMATHDLFRAKEVGHRLGIMKRGRLLDVIDATAVDHSEIERIYLEHMHD